MKGDCDGCGAVIGPNESPVVDRNGSLLCDECRIEEGLPPPWYGEYAPEACECPRCAAVTMTDCCCRIEEVADEDRSVGYCGTALACLTHDVRVD